MLIKIDSREPPEIFELFELLALDKKFDVEKATLEVGDIACGNIVIERKEASDFISSITDGRLQEQASKMCLDYEHKYVVIEGNPFRTQSNINQNAIIGKMTSLLVKNNIKLMFVDNSQQLVYACWSLIQKHIEGNIFNPLEFQKSKYKESDGEIITAMLYQIPNLGIEKARMIAEKYHYSLKKMINEINKEDLTAMDGIGNATADKILNLLLG